MRPIQDHDRRRRDPRHDDDRDRAFARKERPTGFGRCWPLRSRRQIPPRSPPPVAPVAGTTIGSAPACSTSRLPKAVSDFVLGFGAPRFHDRRRGFRLPGRAKAMSRARAPFGRWRPPGPPA